MVSRPRWWIVSSLSLAVALTGCGGGSRGAGGRGTAAAGAGAAPSEPAGGGGAGGTEAEPWPVDSYFPVALADGLAPTPPMGWNSWNGFHCNVSDSLIRETADALAASGMQAAGYHYVNIDDCWAEAARNADGSVQPGANFPDGIAAVADYVHALDLKLGIYSDRGTATCAGRTGSEGHELQDAASYAAWGVDYLKHDNCNATQDAETQYGLMAQALIDTGRPIVFSLCAWRFYEWGVGMGHLWRTTSDITDDWESITSNINLNRRFAAYAGPNGWNDPDMLEVGNGGMTDTEYRAHFSMWAIMASPLIAGNDLREMDAATLEILTNEEVIAVNQDALGLQGVPVWEAGDLSVWAKPLNASGARAVALFNASEAEAELTARWAEVGLAPVPATVRDLWTHTDLGTFAESYTATVPAHGVVLLQVVGGEPAIPRGTVPLSELPWVYAANALGLPERDSSNGASAAGDGEPITLRGVEYEKGIGVAAGSKLIFRLGQGCSAFRADVGVDDSTEGRGSVVFRVIADGEELHASSVLTSDSPVEHIEVDVTGKHRLVLFVGNGGDGDSWDRASWADAELTCAD